MKRIIQISDYQSVWATQFEQEKQAIETVLGPVALLVEHIGSTAVPGLAAKPIIDIQIMVSSLQDIDNNAHYLETLGYRARGENGITGRRYFQKGNPVRSHHVHAFEPDHSHLLKHRLFRDYLCAHPDIAARYALLKRRAIAKGHNSSMSYQAFKQDFIVEHLNKAMLMTL